uniref:Polymerase basic protein 2 n=1 Tax=Salamander influenza-like virus TaxID=2777034 RepID=A0A866VZU6_9ORTO|nr:polymerase basic 2 [Salamander influenza-like virus]
MTLAKIKKLKKLMEENESHEVLVNTTVDNVSIIRKFNTSRMEKNPSLRMKWQMISKHPLALGKNELAEVIPLEYKGIDLRTKTEDIGTRGCMCSIAAVSWWNTHGPIGSTAGFEEVYSAFFERKARLEEGHWGNITYAPVERVRKRVLIHPVRKEMPPSEATQVIMEILFPREAGIPKASAWTHKDLIQEKREALKDLNVMPMVMAYMLEREFVARRRYLPVSGATAPEHIEVLHCTQGDNWKQEFLPGDTKISENRSQAMIVACRGIVRRAMVSANRLETALDIAQKTSINGEPLMSVLMAIDGGETACDLIRGALGLKIRQRTRFGRLELKRTSGRGTRVEKEMLFGNGTVHKMTIWRGREEFHVRVGECRGMLHKSENKLNKLIINRASKEDMLTLVVSCLVFSQDVKVFNFVRGELNFMNRASQTLPPMYQLQRYYLSNPAHLLSYWPIEAAPTNPELIGLNSNLEPSSMTLEGVVMSKNIIDDFCANDLDCVTVTNDLCLRKANGEVVMGPHDISDLVSIPTLPITYNSPKMWEMGTTKEITQNTYTWAIKNLTDLKTKYLLNDESLFKWDAFEAFASALPESKRHYYSGFCRALLKQMRDTQTFKTEQFVKLLPFCFSDPKYRPNKEPYQFLKLHLKGGGENFINVKGSSPLFDYDARDNNITLCGRRIEMAGLVDESEKTISLGNAVLAGFLVSGRHDPDLGEFKSLSELEKMAPGEKANFLIYHGKPVTVMKRKRDSSRDVDIALGIKRQRLTVESVNTY